MWHRQRGSVYLSYALLAFAIAIAGSLLVSVHKAFALLLPAAVMVFFMPKLLGLWTRLQASYRFRRQLAQARQRFSSSAILIINGHRNIEEQAVWLDLERNEAGLVSGDRDFIVEELSNLQRVRAVFEEASYATSFHRGRVRIPPRYALMFEFANNRTWELVTLKRRRMRDWIYMLDQNIPDRLDLQAAQEYI